MIVLYRKMYTSNSVFIDLKLEVFFQKEIIWLKHMIRNFNEKIWFFQQLFFWGWSFLSDIWKKCLSIFSHIKHLVRDTLNKQIHYLYLPCKQTNSFNCLWYKNISNMYSTRFVCIKIIYLFLSDLWWKKWFIYLSI